MSARPARSDLGWKATDDRTMYRQEFQKLQQKADTNSETVMEYHIHTKIHLNNFNAIQGVNGCAVYTFIFIYRKTCFINSS